jgi:protein TonB
MGPTGAVYIGLRRDAGAAGLDFPGAGLGVRLAFAGGGAAARSEGFGMTYLQQPRSPLQTLPGLGLVILLHVGLIYALLNGLGTNVVEKFSPPTTVRFIDSTKPPPPPPTPPAPQLVTPTTVFVPRIDVDIPPPPVSPNAPTATSNVPAPAAPAPRVAASAEHPFLSSLIVGGDRSPAYPAIYEDSARPGKVRVDCIIETDGNPTHCVVLEASGGAAFAAETIRWLTGPAHPVYRPAVRDGQAQREEHQWVISFQPPE